MLNKSYPVFLLLLWPLFAHAEVLDKVAQPVDMWVYAAAGIALVYIALRIHWFLVPVALIYPALWFSNLLLDLNSADLGPAIHAEAGTAYAVHAYGAACSFLLVSIVLFIRKRKKPR